MSKPTLRISRSKRLLDAALYYRCELNWSVIPVEPRGKRPLVPWEQYQREPATEEQIRRWWTEHPTANIGIVTGAVSGVVVLDLDGEEGAKSLEQFPELEPTPFSNTGKGQHFIFKHPGDTELRNFVKKHPGLDFRGDGGYIVAPPSVHPSGHVYTWGVWPHQQPPADLPGWLRDLVSSNGHAPTAAPPSAETERIREGGRNDALTRLAGSMRRKGFTPEAIEAALQRENEARCDPPLPEKEVREIARSVGRYEPTAPVNGKAEKSEATVELPALRCLADVQPEKVSWLWEPRIPLGHLTVLSGDPGIGKSYISCALATALSLGRGLPGADPGEPFDTILLTAEDHLAMTVRPRLDAMDADVSRIHACDQPFALDATGRTYLETLIRATSARLVVVDPVTAYLPPGLDFHRANEMRSVTAPLSDIAERLNCAILIVGHLSKNSGAKALYRSLGSIDLPAAGRSVLLAGADPDDPASRGLFHLKSNVGPLANPLGFSIIEGLFCWTGTTTLTTGQVLAAESEAAALAEAKAFLLDLLSNGPRPSKDVEDEAEGAGVSKRTIWRAKTALGVKTYKPKGVKDARWLWELPAQSPDAHHQSVGEELDGLFDTGGKP